MDKSGVVVKELKGVRGLRAFIDFPFSLYKDSSNWVPALRADDMNVFRKDKNPAYEFSKAKFWLAYRDGKPVGRIAGIINQRAIDKWEKYLEEYKKELDEKKKELEEN